MLHGVSSSNYNTELKLQIPKLKVKVAHLVQLHLQSLTAALYNLGSGSSTLTLTLCHYVTSTTNVPLANYSVGDP